MNQQLSSANPLVKTETSSVEVLDSNKNLTSKASLEKWLRLGYQMTEIIEQIPLYWREFWQAYQRPLTLLAWLIGIWITLTLVISVLDAIHDIPLLPSLLKLVGLGCAIWFVSRYIIAFVSRQELSAKFTQLRNYIWGE